ncbi:aldehyde dehydrogenase family protein [Leptolyngbya iicbica]|uniref:Aldehyde dehydrogenase family protein n=2 Tax=Cyanophyceae TaxID=3028117 RepID=A0A4Q7E3D5_9CYAN|nr:aldehyde dehydrogenase family protein [Leptolyngbya sp. LK]RZM76048.1 aldehyde dehydrogenase family protein [Leptolyngbya sp. LK]
MTSVQSLAELSVLIRQIRQAAEALEVRPTTVALQTAAQAFREAADDILEANTLDLEASLEMAVPELVVEWLKLTPERLNTAIVILERLAQLDAVTTSTHRPQPAIAPTDHAYWLREPLGVIALVYEAFPELAIIAAALSLRAGNGLILKGGHEASQTNQVIADVFQGVLAQVDLPEQIIVSLSPSEGEAARRWLMQTSELDLVIPYGRASLVQQVMRDANSPSLSTAIGNCYVYWAPTAPVEVVAKIIIASHRGNPEPVNGIEKVLVDEKVSPVAERELEHLLQDSQLSVKDVASPTLSSDLDATVEELWQEAQLDRTVLMTRVPNLSAAIALINRFSSGHADCIVTNSYQESMQFSSQVRSASIYINSSPQFQRNASHTSAIALGMSPQRGLKSGRITLETLLMHKAIVQGMGNL